MKNSMTAILTITLGLAATPGVGVADTGDAGERSGTPTPPHTLVAAANSPIIASFARVLAPQTTTPQPFSTDSANDPLLVALTGALWHPPSTPGRTDRPA